MSNLYWKSNIISTTDSNRIDFTPKVYETTGIPNDATNVGDALRAVARRKTGIIKFATINVPNSNDGRQTIQFNDTEFNENMYVDYYCDKEITFYQFPTYQSSSKTITFYIDKLSADFTQATFKIVVQF